MTFANPLPLWVFLAVSGAAFVVAASAYAHAPLTRGRRAVLSAARFTTLLLCALILMRPMVAMPGHPMDTVVPILVDTSRSMSIEDVPEGRRIDRAGALVSELLPTIPSRVVTEVLAFGDRVAPATPATLTSTARRSDVSSALREVAARYRGRHLAGIILISDGGHELEEDDPGWMAAAPVFPIGIGSGTWERDREVLSVTALESVLDDSLVDVAVVAVSNGYGTEPTELRLLENGRAIDVRRVRPASDGTPVREVFQVTPGRDGATLYTVEIPAASGEVVPENNARSVLIQPPARPRRVLLLQGAPGHEHSFLRRAWRGDADLEVDAVVRQGQNAQGADTHYIQASAGRSGALASGFPATRADLFAYDAVVLANVGRGLVSGSRQRDLHDFVRLRGGGLLVLGAQALQEQGLGGTALEEVVPLDLSDRRAGTVPASAAGSSRHPGVTLTTPGEAHPVMQLAASADHTRARWDALPNLASVAPLGAARPGATVLALAAGAGGAPRPLVAVQRYGDGRSMVFAGEASWRWRMRLPASDRTFDMFWRQAIRWLALPAGDPVAIVAPQDARPGDTVTIGVVARSAAFEPIRAAEGIVRVTSPDGRSEDVPTEPDPRGDAGGRLVARYRAEEPGVYRISAEVRAQGRTPLRAATSVLVGGADAEMADPRLNAGVLQRIAASSGGQLIEPDAVGDLVRALSATPPALSARPRRDIWHTPWAFAVTLVLIGGEWILRRRWGLR